MFLTLTIFAHSILFLISLLVLQNNIIYGICLYVFINLIVLCSFLSVQPLFWHFESGFLLLHFKNWKLSSFFNGLEQFQIA